jgi:hypothetical protein
LEATREDVVAEVMSAPLRRQDNEITRLSESVQVLTMHCKVVDELLAKYQRLRWQFRLIIFGATTTSAGLTAGLFYAGAQPEHVIVGACCGIVGVVATHWLQSRNLERQCAALTDVDSYDGVTAIYNKIYSRSISDKDVYVASLWGKVREHLRHTIHRSKDLSKLQRVSSSDFDTLKYMAETELQQLRRRSAPELNPSKFSKLTNQTNQGSDPKTPS